MRLNIKKLRSVLRGLYEDLDRERRAADYGDEDEGSGVSYGDRYSEDVDRLRRAEDGYGETEFEESIEEELLEANLYSDACKKKR